MAMSLLMLALLLSPWSLCLATNNTAQELFTPTSGGLCTFDFQCNTGQINCEQLCINGVCRLNVYRLTPNANAQCFQAAQCPNPVTPLYGLLPCPNPIPQECGLDACCAVNGPCYPSETTAATCDSQDQCCLAAVICTKLPDQCMFRPAAYCTLDGPCNCELVGGVTCVDANPENAYQFPRPSCSQSVPCPPIPQAACPYAPGSAPNCDGNACVGCSGANFFCNFASATGSCDNGCCSGEVNCVASFFPSATSTGTRTPTPTRSRTPSVQPSSTQTSSSSTQTPVPVSPSQSMTSFPSMSQLPSTSSTSSPTSTSSVTPSLIMSSSPTGSDEMSSSELPATATATTTTTTTTTTGGNGGGSGSANNVDIDITLDSNGKDDNDSNLWWVLLIGGGIFLVFAALLAGLIFLTHVNTRSRVNRPPSIRRGQSVARIR